MQSELFKRIITSIFLIPFVLFSIIKGSFFFYFIIITAFFISSYEWHVMSKKKSYYIFGFIFLIISFFCFYKLRFNSDNDFTRLLFITIICILTDIGGFTFGKLFGGPKLTKYSPNKTYAGVIGAYFFSLLLVFFITTSNLFIIKNINSLLIFAILVSSVSQIGDIIISYFKRISKIKDTGKIIPGHGGLLDRIDGMIFAYPFSYLLIATNSIINI